MIAMKHEPQPPIRPRQRAMQGSLAATNIGRQPKRVVIRVPYVETGMNPASAQYTTPERQAGSASTTPSREVANVGTSATVKPAAPTHATPIERTIRIDAAHEAVPSPHAPMLAAKQSTGWLTSVLQKKTLLALGLIISILILAVVIHQRSDSAADSASPHPRYAKSERHASVAHKSQIDDVAANATQLTTPPRRSQSSTATPPILRQSLANDFNGGPMLLKNDTAPTNATATATNAAANAPATLGGSADNSATNNDQFVPKMHDLIPPHEALAPPVTSGTAEAQYFGFAPGEGTSPIAVAARAGASFEGPISNSPISAPVLKK
jgi:hypothetical protein